MNRKINIQVDMEVKRRLDALKVHPRQPINEVIKTLLDKVTEE